MPKKANLPPFRKADRDNLPLQKARYLFLEHLAEHCQVLEAIRDEPLRLWTSLSKAARELCLLNGWSEILHSPEYQNFSPEAIRHKPILLEQQKIHLEIVPLREALISLAHRFNLLYDGRPAAWAMESVVETLNQAERRRNDTATARWPPPLQMSQTYPARTDLGWNMPDGKPEEELFNIVIQIAPKQPSESRRAFEKRYMSNCRRGLDEYLKRLKAEAWTTVSQFDESRWISFFAQWQAGRSTSEIGPSVKTRSQRVAFSRSIRRVGEYLQISPRLSKHHPQRKRTLTPPRR